MSLTELETTVPGVNPWFRMKLVDKAFPSSVSQGVPGNALRQGVEIADD